MRVHGKGGYASQVLAGSQAHRCLLGLTATLDQGVQSGGCLICLRGMVTAVLQQLHQPAECGLSASIILIKLF